MFDWMTVLKGKTKKLKKIVDYELHMIAKNGLEFNTWIYLCNIFNWRRLYIII